MSSAISSSFRLVETSQIQNKKFNFLNEIGLPIMNSHNKGAHIVKNVMT